MAVCASEAYVGAVRNRLKGYFDFEEVPWELPANFGTWAHCTMTDEKYFLTRKMSLYTVNSHQFVGLGVFETVTSEALASVFEAAKRLVVRLGPSPSSMSTDYTFALISERAVETSRIRSELRRMRKNQGFAFGMRGWADIGLVVVDLENETVLTNPFARAQLASVLWSFDGKPVAPAKKSILSKIPLFRCSCTGG